MSTRRDARTPTRAEFAPPDLAARSTDEADWRKFVTALRGALTSRDWRYGDWSVSVSWNRGGPSSWTDFRAELSRENTLAAIEIFSCSPLGGGDSCVVVRQRDPASSHTGPNHGRDRHTVGEIVALASSLSMRAFDRYHCAHCAATLSPAPTGSFGHVVE